MTRPLAIALLSAIILLLVGFAVGRAASRPSPNTAYPESAWTRIGAPNGFAAASIAKPDRMSEAARPLMVSAGAPSPSPESSGTGSGVSAAKAYALHILGARQYACLDAIVMHESRWNPLARNSV